MVSPILKFYLTPSFSKMINHAVPGTIEQKLINIKKPLNVFQIKENLSQAIKGATQIGCVIVSITPPLIMEKREHIILGMIWQVLKVFYFFFDYLTQNVFL